MGNWKERIRQAEELAKEQALASQRSRQKESDQRETNIRNAFDLLERLKVEELLAGVKRDVWKEGEIKHFEQEESDCDGRFKIKRKGISLKYFWREPGRRKQEIVGYKKKIELWEGVSSSPVYMDGMRASQYVGKVFRPHIEKVPEYTEVYQMENKSEAMSVFFELRLKSTWGSGERETIKLAVNSSICSIVLASGPFFELKENTEETVAKFLDKALLDDCIGRTKNHQLPADIQTHVKQRIAEIPPSKLRYE